jgi:type III protein arginine methyltransferase
LINKDCRHLKIPEDLSGKADLAVFELFDCSLIGEGVLHFVPYAREHLLKADAVYVPLRAKIRAIVIEYRLDRIWDIDVNLLNPYRFSPSFLNVDSKHLAYRALTEPFDVFDFNFATATAAEDEHDLSIPTITEGTANAILFWFDLQVGETLWLSNDPRSLHQLHWKQGLQFLPGVLVNGVTHLPLIAKHNGSSLTFHWKVDGMPKEAFSNLPLFDARWWRQANSLEQQTRDLLFHCQQNPGEYSKVAEIAMRFAIDPAAHGLDPIIAEKFAMTFFGK